MSKRNIAVIGSGSVFTAELVEKLSEAAPELGDLTLRFMDIDRERQEIVTAFCRRLLEKKGCSQIEIVCSRSVEECVSGAEFILLQLRQGGIDARIQDEKLGLKYKLPFTETISICGFSTFLRSYYEYERLASIISRHAPDAWVLNFTNPAGQLSETLDRLGIKKVVGVCNAFIGMMSSIEKTLKISSGEYLMNWRGLNHLTIVDGIYHNGTNRFQEYIDLVSAEHPSTGTTIAAALDASLNGYYMYYFDRVQIVEKQQRQAVVRSETVKEIDEQLLAEYVTATVIPEGLSKRGGYGYSTAVVNVLKAICLNEGTIHYAVVKNGSTLPNLPSDAFVEVPVYVTSKGPFPVVTDPLPDFASVMTLAVKTYERALITAAMDRSKKKMLNSMMIHPLLNCFSVAEPLLADCLASNRAFLPDIG